MSEGKWLLGLSINNLGNLHQVDTDQLLQSEDGGKMIRRVVENQKADFGVRSKESLEMRNDKRRQKIGVGEGVVLSLVGQRLCGEGLHRVRNEISEKFR